MNKLEKNAFLLIRRGIAGTRAELARELAVSRPTASTVVEKLLEQELVCERGKGKSTGGTTPILLTVNPKSAYYIGIDLGYTDRMSAVLIDHAGTIISDAETEFSRSDLRDLAEKASFLIKKVSGRKKISGVAVALSGIVDEKTMSVTKSINPFHCGQVVPELLERVTGYPVSIWNRSRAAAVSEAFGGAGDKESDFALISLGASIGSAFWSDGRIFDGRHSSAGEIRNLRLSCGLRFEDALSLTRIQGCGIDNVLELCADGLSQVISIMDLELLILSGRFADFSPDFPEKLEKILQREYSVRVRSARYGRNSAARGAAFRMGEMMILQP
ncbi:MAG: ROK family protein [Lentisphaeria bacterium]|nr:ROK family protein [Lentisphaeria bacterium]